MNKKGSVLMGLVLGIMVFMAGMLFVNHLKDDVTTFRSADNLDCSNLSITDGQKLTCLGGDVTIPYFMVAVLSVVFGIVAVRFAVG